MRLELNPEMNMKSRKFLDRINPWAGLLGAFCIILPSLYDILDAPLKITNDHFILAGGLFFFVFFLREIFTRIVNLGDKNKEY